MTSLSRDPSELPPGRPDAPIVVSAAGCLIFAGFVVGVVEPLLGLVLLGAGLVVAVGAMLAKAAH